MSQTVVVVQKPKAKLSDLIHAKKRQVSENHKAGILTCGVKLDVFGHGFVFFPIFSGRKDILKYRNGSSVIDITLKNLVCSDCTLAPKAA